jgi:hypothetical protein
MIFMTHTQHGAMHAANEADAVKHEAIGWQRSTYAKWLGDKSKPVEDVAPMAAAESPVATEPKKRGRPAKVSQ